MSLTLEMQEFKYKYMAQLPKDVAEVISIDIERNVEAGIEKQALQIGDYVPDFALRNAMDMTIETTDLLNEGPMIISFYRGAWCPYCNLELKTYQDILPEIKELGAQLVAISPSLPDDSISLIDKYNLDYEVLSDIGNDVARQFGIVYKMSDELIKTYKRVGLDLKEVYKNDSYELPMPGTFIVNSNGMILDAQVSYDYTKRMDPEHALKVLRDTSY